MNSFLVVGTDTDAGKTAFSLLFLAAFPTEFAYWKPVETGESDTEKLRRLVPSAQIFEPHARFTAAVAPVLAAEREKREMPGLAAILEAQPVSDRPLLLESFGSPLSPLTRELLQIDLLRAWQLPVLLVANSSVGAVGRSLQALQILELHGIRPAALVLLGADDPFAREQIERHASGITIVSLQAPVGPWTAESIATAAESQRETLRKLLPGSPRAAPDFAESRSVWYPYTPLQGSDAPLPVVGAVDEFLMLADGRLVIDGISSWWTILHGHRPPAIMEAIRTATRTLDHTLFAGATHPHAIELADQLLATLPWPEGGRIFYSDNGSTAVEVALKMAYQFWCHRGEPHRTLFISFEQGYHGDTFGAMSVGRDPLFFGRFEPLLFHAVQSPVCAERLDALLSKHAHEVAALIIEPLVQGAGGMQMHSPAELEAIFAVARRHGVLFIADEVMTGFGRTGSLWAFEQAGIAPDLVCLAKGITGGVMPLAATAAAPRVVAAFDTADRTYTLFHGHSFTANPLACAAAVANGKLMQSHEWLTQVKRITTHWEAHRAEFQSLPRVKDVRIRGLIAAIELDWPGGYLAQSGRTMRRAGLEQGVLLRPLGNVLYALPPLCTSAQSLARITTAMMHAVRCAS